MGYEWVPILISALFAYIVADCFISVCGMAVDTIFLCFCEDSDRNDGQDRPYYMSTGLMQFLSDSEAALKAEKERKYAKRASLLLSWKSWKICTCKMGSCQRYRVKRISSHQGLKPPSSAGS